MNLLDLPLHRLDGEPTTLRQLGSDGAVLLVNVASACGLTPQYEGLQRVHEQYAVRGLTVVGVPCNQFGDQEPGGPQQIAQFCSTTYGADFPMTEKLEVNGPGAHPVFAELRQASDATGHDGDLRWNFEKFLIDEGGQVVARFDPRTQPEDPALLARIEDLVSR